MQVGDLEMGRRNVVRAFIARLVTYLRREPYECLGALSGGIGAWLISENNLFSKWGWVLFLISNVMFLTMGFRKRLYGLMAAQSYFTYTSLNGIFHYF